MFILKISILFFTFRLGWCWTVRQRGLPQWAVLKGNSAPQTLPTNAWNASLVAVPLAKQPCMAEDGSSMTRALGLGAGLRVLPWAPHWRLSAWGKAADPPTTTALSKVSAPSQAQDH